MQKNLIFVFQSKEKLYLCTCISKGMQIFLLLNFP